MATVTRENIGLLHDKLTVTVSPADYQPAFEKSLKQYAKNANIPGFRKGMVPAGLIKKMYGPSLFVDEVLKTVEKEIGTYIEQEKLDIFAQPLPLTDNFQQKIDFNKIEDYALDFEIGLKPTVLPDVKAGSYVRYKVEVTETMIEDEVSRLRTRFGNMTEPETVESEETALNVTFTELDADGNVKENGINKANSLVVKYFAEAFRTNLLGKKKDDVVDVHIATAFEDAERATVLADLGLDKDEPASADKTFKMTITKIGLVEKADFNEAFFSAAYPGKNIANEEDFRNVVKEDIEAYFAAQAANQLHDQIYHQLVDHTPLDLPAGFLKNWLMKSGEKAKSAEEAEKELPSFLNSLKWSYMSSKLSEQHQIQVTQDDIKAHAIQQLFSYLGGQLGALGDDQQWIDDYANRMLKDKKFVEETYHRVNVEKLFKVLETEITATEESIGAEDFASKLHHHHH